MNVLLLRPDPGNERFGLGPFFRVEPLGLEYVASALAERGHSAEILDLRFRASRLAGWIRRTRPRVVGISAMHVRGLEEMGGGFPPKGRERGAVLPQSRVLLGQQRHRPVGPVR